MDNVFITLNLLCVLFTISWLMCSTVHHPEFCVCFVYNIMDNVFITLNFVCVLFTISWIMCSSLCNFVVFCLWYHGQQYHVIFIFIYSIYGIYDMKSKYKGWDIIYRYLYYILLGFKRLYLGSPFTGFRLYSYIKVYCTVQNKKNYFIKQGDFLLSGPG